MSTPKAPYVSDEWISDRVDEYVLPYRTEITRVVKECRDLYEPRLAEVTELLKETVERLKHYPSCHDARFKTLGAERPYDPITTKGFHLWINGDPDTGTESLSIEVSEDAGFTFHDQADAHAFRVALCDFFGEWFHYRFHGRTFEEEAAEEEQFVRNTEKGSRTYEQRIAENMAAMDASRKADEERSNRPYRPSRA